MKINGSVRTEIGFVLIRFDEGVPMALENHPHLACKVALLGNPTRVQRLGSARYCAEWDLPGSVESIMFGNPYPLDRRKVVALEVEREAYAAVRGWLESLIEKAHGDVQSAASVLDSLCSTRRIVAERRDHA